MRTAAPHHQEQNGLAESRWRIIRSRAMSMLTHARLSFIFFDSALVYALYVTNALPLKGLFTKDSDGETTRPATPFKLYFGTRPKLTRFRVFGCPVVFKAYARQPNLQDHNILQRGVRGIFVGFPINQAGVLIWVEQVCHFMVSADVYYDEQFTSCLAYNHKLFSDSIPVRQPTYRIGRVPVPTNVHRTTLLVISISIVKLGGYKYASKIFSSGFLVLKPKQGNPQ
jgi:hypothetical protein